MSKKVKVVVKRVGQPAMVEMINDTLEAKQAIVGGWIEVLNVERHAKRIDAPNPKFAAIAMVMNEEGNIEGLPINFQFPGWIPTVGNVFFDRTDEDGESIDLTDDDIKYIMNFLSACRLPAANPVNAENAGFGKSKLPS